MPLPPFAYNVSTTSRGEPLTGEDWNHTLGWIGGTTSTGAVDPDAHAHTGLASAGVKINFANLLAGANPESGKFSIGGIFSAGGGFETNAMSVLGQTSFGGHIIPLADNVFNFGSSVLRWKDGFYSGTVSVGSIFSSSLVSAGSYQNLPLTSSGTITGSGTIGNISKWKTSTSLTDSGLVESGVVISGADRRIDLTRSSGLFGAFLAFITGDTQARAVIFPQPELRFGPGGATAADTILGREGIGIFRIGSSTTSLSQLRARVHNLTSDPIPGNQGFVFDRSDLDVLKWDTGTQIRWIADSPEVGLVSAGRGFQTSSLSSVASIVPIQDNLFDLGQISPTNQRWRDAYFSGTISAGTVSAGTYINLPAGGGYDTIQDEGTPLTQRTTIDFTGTGVTASDSGSKTTVNIPGAAGATNIKQTEFDFGIVPTFASTGTIVDSDVSLISQIQVTQAFDAATGKMADENEMDSFLFVASAGTGLFRLRAESLQGRVVGAFKINYLIG